MLFRSVADPFHLIQIRIQDMKKFITDPDPGRFLVRIRIPDPGKNDTDADPDKKGLNTRKILKMRKNYHFSIKKYGT